MAKATDKFDLCGYCCNWVHAMEGKSPATVRDAYPKMMRKVLKERFDMPKKAAKRFIAEACDGNWERLHETAMEKSSYASDYAEKVLGDVWYCSDRWSYDRVLRIQWFYKRLCDRIRDDGDD